MQKKRRRKSHAWAPLRLSNASESLSQDRSVQHTASGGRLTAELLLLKQAHAPLGSGAWVGGVCCPTLRLQSQLKATRWSQWQCTVPKCIVEQAV